MAAYCGQSHVARELLRSKKTNVNAGDLFGRTPLFVASRYGHVSTVKALIEDGRVLVNSADWYGSTAIWAAIRNCHHDVVEALLPLANISANSRDFFGHTMLWWAQKTGNHQLIQLLPPDEEPSDPYLPEHEDLEPHEVPQSAFDRYAYWCEVCTLYLSQSSGYDCRVCNDGTCICRRCYEMGFRCRFDSHELIKRGPRASGATKLNSTRRDEAECGANGQHQLSHPSQAGEDLPTEEEGLTAEDPRSSATPGRLDALYLASDPDSLISLMVSA